MARKKKDWAPKQGKWDMVAMEKAVMAVRGGMAKKRASVLYKVPRSTLRGRLNMEDITVPPSRPTIMTHKEENILVNYVLKMEERGFGVSVIDIRKLAFQMAQKLGRKGFNEGKKCAGYDWWIGFAERHPVLSVRKPEGLSAARSSMLNPSVVASYFTKLRSVMEEIGVKDKPQQIYNADESGISTVHNPDKIVGRKGKKGVYAKTSGERGENVTVLCCINAEARVLPPMVIFKGQRVSESLKSNAPPGSEFGCSKSSFIDSDLFGKWFTNIFVKHLPPARPVLLILDGHSSHLNIDVLEKASENQIEMFCLPPHTTHWLQPLDKSIFGPMKKAYNKQCQTFMKDHPSRQVTRYDVCGLFNAAFQASMNMVNIFSGFRSTGIYPFNPSAVPQDAYGPSKTSVLPDTTCTINQTNQEECRNSTQNTERNICTNQENENENRIVVIAEVHTTVDNEAENRSRQSDHTNEISATPDNMNTRPEHNFDEILVVPEVQKTTQKKKTKRITTSRLLTDKVHLSEMREKMKLKELKAKEIEAKRKQREEKRKEKLKELLTKPTKSTMKTNKRVHAKSKENKSKKSTKEEKNETESSLYCTFCNGYYFDDNSDDEDWIK